MSRSATAPAAFDYLFNLMTTAVATGQDTSIQVVDTLLGTYEQAEYIELTEIANHHFDIESLPLFAFFENYDLIGQVSVFRGDQDFKQARDSAWANYETYVRTPIITDGNRLGDTVLWIVPASVNAVNEVTDVGGASTTITFSFSCTARVTNS
jgi:hypothetical protein